MNKSVIQLGLVFLALATAVVSIAWSAQRERAPVAYNGMQASGNAELTRRGASSVPGATSADAFTSESVTKEKSTPATGVAYAEFDFDPTDTFSLVANAQLVFIGRVKERVGEESIGGTNYRKFAVDVLSLIKGNPDSQRVSLIQTDAWYNKRGQLVVLNGDVASLADKNPEDIFLRVGAVYAFAATCDADFSLCGVGLPTDRSLISSDSSLSDTQINSLADQSERVQEFRNVADALEAGADPKPLPEPASWVHKDVQ